MLHSDSSVPQWHRVLRVFTLLGVGMWCVTTQPLGWTAETSDPTPLSTTLVALKLDTESSLPVRTKFESQPPTIVIEFPAQQVAGNLPEHTPISNGALQTIETRYYEGASTQRARFIRSVRIALTAAYTYRVRSEPGRVVVEIDHPASVGRASVEVGLRGGTVVRQLGAEPVSERFRAMQEALAKASPAPWTMELIPASLTASGNRLASPASGRSLQAGALQTVRQSSSPSPHVPRPDTSSSAVALVVLTFAVTATGVIGVWWISRSDASLSGTVRSTAQDDVRMPSGVRLIDQLVWRAFERQGYQLLMEQELTKPSIGTLRVIAKEGIKSGLLCVGNGPFFEKQTVERFMRAIQDAEADRGFLVTSGSFTVPAQRLANDHQITLIGRDELIELLSAGAASEYVSKQLEQQSTRLSEARDTLQQLASELETLRRQRNEASWFLGEERAKSAKLETALAEFHEQLRTRETEIQRLEQDVLAMQKQWEESQWYLGESKEHSEHLHDQLDTLQDITKLVETAQRERDEAIRALEEEQAKRTALDTTLTELQRMLADVASREQALQHGLAQLTQELKALRAYGERRRNERVQVGEARVEFSNGKETPSLSGIIRDISRTGIGVETDQELSTDTALRVQLRLPGLEEPITSKGRLVWQRANGQGYHSGFRLLGLSPSARTRLSQCIERAQVAQG